MRPELKNLQYALLIGAVLSVIGMVASVQSAEEKATKAGGKDPEQIEIDPDGRK